MNIRLRFIIIVMVLMFVFVEALSQADQSQEKEFEQELESATKVTQLYNLLERYPDQMKILIPRIEAGLIEEIKSNPMKSSTFHISDITTEKNRYRGRQSVTVRRSSEGDKVPFIVWPAGNRMWLMSPDIKPNYNHGELLELDAIGSITLKMDTDLVVVLEYSGDRILPYIKDSSGGLEIIGLSTSDIPRGQGSIHRFDGKVGIFGYTFINEGDKFERLTFLLLDEVGYVFLRGKGKVIMKDGKEIMLGDKKDP